VLVRGSEFHFGKFVGHMAEDVFECEARPGLVFGASTWFGGRDGFAGQEDRDAGEIAAVGNGVRNGFEVLLNETHAGDAGDAVGFDEEDGGNHGEAVGVGDGVVLIVYEDGKGDAEVFGEFGGGCGIVLGDGEEGDVFSAIALVEAFKERKSEFANGAGDFEKGQDDGAGFKRFGE